ncbi:MULTISPECIES: hypothetical protein [Haloferax]|uniref:Uncharacterized protein n=2 Tax=Haloferax TaxID=2251 RepID=A0A6G1Z522_9EURY|nr:MULTISPECIES: hypothetical protein [Haloferax]KAB1188936.1 hypothetical protein Hfx1149_13190 [Haloferax sp. CBA1149]MRW81659.1 hypothetical protein [Haloferax marinisediminis]
MSYPADKTPLHETTGVRIAVVVVLLVTLAYSLLIAQQILLWVFLVVGAVSLWFAARLVVAMEQIARHLGRLADAESEDRNSAKNRE